MRRSLLGLLTFCLLTGSAEAATRYVAPAGSGTACSEAAPCGVVEGVNNAPANDTVIVGTGTYGGPSDGLNLTADSNISVQGAVIGPGRPVIYGRLTVNDTSSARDLSLRGTSASSDPLRTNGSAVVDRLESVVGPTTPGDGCSVAGGTVTNTLCVGRPNTLSGLGMGGAGTLRHVTAVGSIGLFKNSGTAGTIKAAIAVGNSSDIGNQGVLSLFDVAFQGALGGTVTTNQGQITAEPVFRNAASGDYRQGASSPTIDAGDLVDADVASGELDLNGNLRTIGAHTDAGAYEHVPQPPLAVTLPPTNATGTSAQLGGLINGFGGAMTYYFEYGPTTGYGSATPPARLVGSDGISVAVSTLAFPPGVTHYRLVVVTDAGSAFGADQTVPLPPVPTATSASAITAGAATLAGTVVTNAGDAAVRFEYGKVGGPLTPTAETTQAGGPVSRTVTGLEPATEYRYVVVARTQAGEVTSEPVNFTTLPEAPLWLLAPVEAVTATSATLVGAADLKQATTGRIHFSLDGVARAEQDYTGGRFADALTGLTPNTTYAYRLRIETAGGTSESEQQTFKTLPLAPLVSGVEAKDVSATTATLAASVDLLGAATGTGRFVVDGVSTPDQAVTGGMVTAPVTGLAPNTDHSVRFVVTSPGGTTQSAVSTFRTLPASPAATALPASNVALRGATLRGTVDTKGVSGQARFVLDGLPQTPSSTDGGELSLDVSGLAPNSQHSYFVRVTTTGGSVDSAPTTFRTAKGLFASLRVAKSFVQREISIKRRAIKAVVRCANLPCSVKVSGTVVAGEKTIGTLTAPAGADIAAGTRKRVALTLSRGLQAKVLKAAAKRPRPTIIITGTFTASDGTIVERAATMGIRRQR